MKRALLVFATLLAGCSTTAEPDRTAILAIGDSIMAWNGDAGIPEVTAAALDRRVVDASVSGAKLVQDSGGLAALGLDIQKQWLANRGRWSWVMLDGGANDLRDVCRTPDEAATLDGIISDDLTGALPNLVARIRTTRSRVAIMGYYDGAEAEPAGFTPCQPAFTTMNERLARLADSDPDIVFVDAGRAIDPARTELYADDLIHPSPEGSRLIGEAMAERMRNR